MRIEFRRIWDAKQPAAAGEILLRPPPQAEVQARELALRTIQQGPEAFECGAQPWTTLVVTAEPTLDDMLAASLLTRQLEQHPLPQAAESLATYAALARKGLSPAAGPFEVSIEGVYLATRGRHLDLEKPEVAARFLQEWQHLEQRLFDDEHRVDPFRESPFATGHQFAEQRAYLQRDREVYRQDVLRGQRWKVHLPEGPAESSALLLRQPKSVLFKYWSREDTEAPLGNAYLLLIVESAPGRWIVSTDPAQRLSLRELAQRLQQAESQVDAVRARSDPWFDGAVFDYSLIAAPHAGTALPVGEVLGIIRHWCHARPLNRAWQRGPLVTAATAATAVMALAAFGYALSHRPSTELGDQRGMEVLSVMQRDEQTVPAPRKGRDYALLIAGDQYDHWQKLGNPVRDAETMAATLTEKFGFNTEVVKNPKLEDILGTLRRYSEKITYGPQDQLFIFVAGHGDFVPATKEGFVVARDSLPPNKDRYRTTYIPHSRLRDLIEKIPCRHVLVVLDVCFGGTIEFGTAIEPMRGGVYEEVSKDEFIARKLTPVTRRYITSGGKVEVSDGLPGQHSPFARLLLEAMATAGGDDGILTYYEMLQHVERGVEPPTMGQLRGNEPQGDFLLIARNNPDQPAQ